jgi:cobalt-zinc-cadmium efflux system protein
VSRTQRLAVVLVLNLVLVAGLAAVGARAHSLAVLAAGGDYLLDAAGVGVALLAIWLSARPASSSRPAGYPNATNIAALINGGWLLALELLVGGAALDRLVTRTPAVKGLPVLLACSIAALVMTAGALILRGDGNGDSEAGEGDLALTAVLLDTIADAAAAAGVAAAGGIILATGSLYWLDPAVALAIAIIVAYHAVALIRKVLRRLMSATADSNH